MPRIIYIEPDGQTRSVEVAVGQSVMQGAMRNAIAGVVAECGGACACATCHVHVDPAWIDRLPPPNSNEEAMLEFALEVDPTSRLSCQIKVAEALDGLIVRVADAQL